MSLPFVSLSSATSIGVGDAHDLETVANVHTLVVSTTGSPTGFVVRLEGSHDAVNWFEMASANEGAPVVTIANHLVRCVRARWSGITGGTSPTVTASIASALI